jgi:hypothetical protein
LWEVVAGGSLWEGSPCGKSWCDVVVWGSLWGVVVGGRCRGSFLG